MRHVRVAYKQCGDQGSHDRDATRIIQEPRSYLNGPRRLGKRIVLAVNVTAFFAVTTITLPAVNLFQNRTVASLPCPWPIRDDDKSATIFEKLEECIPYEGDAGEGGDAEEDEAPPAKKKRGRPPAGNKKAGKGGAKKGKGKAKR